MFFPTILQQMMALFFMPVMFRAVEGDGGGSDSGGDGNPDGTSDGGQGDGDKGGDDKGGKGGSQKSLLDDAGGDDKGGKPDDKGGDGKGEWYLREGIKGEGDKPEWFNDKKYKTIEDQAKAQRELEKRFGAFTGAPENYELKLPVGEDGQPLVEGEFDTDHPILKQFMADAKEMGLSQDGFERILGMFATYEAQANSIDVAAQKEQIGKDADSRIKSLAQWGGANLSPDEYNVFKGMTATADQFKVLEKLVQKSRPAQVPRGDTVNSDGMTPDKLREMKFAKDANGNRKTETDPDYAARVKKAYADYYGTEPVGDEVVR